MNVDAVANDDVRVDIVNVKFDRLKTSEGATTTFRSLSSSSKSLPRRENLQASWRRFVLVTPDCLLLR